MKLIIAGFLFLTITNCGRLQRTYTAYTGEMTEKCHRGVTVIQSDSGIAILLGIDGKTVACQK